MAAVSAGISVCAPRHKAGKPKTGRQTETESIIAIVYHGNKWFDEKNGFFGNRITVDTVIGIKKKI